MKEIWKDVEELNNDYKISNLGRLVRKEFIREDTWLIYVVEPEVEVIPKSRYLYKGTKKLSDKAYLIAKYFVPNPKNSKRFYIVNPNKPLNEDNIAWGQRTNVFNGECISESELKKNAKSLLEEYDLSLELNSYLL